MRQLRLWRRGNFCSDAFMADWEGPIDWEKVADVLAEEGFAETGDSVILVSDEGKLSIDVLATVSVTEDDRINLRIEGAHA